MPPRRSAILPALPDAFRSRIDEVLRAQNLGIGDLALRLGVDAAHLGRVFNRRRPGSALLFFALAKQLGAANWAWCLDVGDRPADLAARS